MATITVFPSLIKAAEKDSLYLRKILFAFMPGPHKIALDNKGVIMQRYKDVACSEMIYKWLELMSYADGFVNVKVDIDKESTDETRCLKLCCSTKGNHTAFVNNLQEINIPLTAHNSVLIDNEEVFIKDKDEAVECMNKPTVQFNMKNSIIANGSVTNSNNNNSN